jgi:hypothetical protein
MALIHIKDTSAQILETVFTHIKNTENASTKSSRIYFTDYTHYKPDPFEKLSNKLKVGVVAKEKTNGLALLALTRGVIGYWPKDNFPEGIKEDMEEDDKKIIPIEDGIKRLGVCEKDDAISFNLDEIFTNSDNVSKKIHEVDVFTLARTKTFYC